MKTHGRRKAGVEVGNDNARGGPHEAQGMVVTSHDHARHYKTAHMPNFVSHMHMRTKENRTHLYTSLETDRQQSQRGREKPGRERGRRLSPAC